MRHIFLTALFFALLLTEPAQSRQWHWSGNTLVSDGGWRWHIHPVCERVCRRWGYNGRICYACQPAVGMQGGLWAGYGWRSYALTPQAIAHSALCANLLRQVYGRNELPHRCWE